VKLATPTGEKSIALDSNGNGTTPYTIDSVGVFTFANIQQTDQMNVIWQSPLVTVCAKDCESPFGSPVSTTVEPDTRCEVANT
jgi:hypothetical protein